MTNNSFSVLMSVYKNDNPVHFRIAVESVTINQTLPPNEVVIVVDGPVPDELTSTIKTLENEIPYIKVHWLSHNGGLGNALRIGVEIASNEIIVRMDSDDVSTPDRFEKQIRYMTEHPECDVLGGQITEFVDDETNIVGKRLVPCSHKEIFMWLKGRCPFNHVSVTMLRSRVLEIGNYMDWHFNEDYYLWIRMAEAGFKFANLPDTLVNVRVGKDMYARRGGWKYFKSEKGLQDYMLRKSMISVPRYLYNVAGRFAIQVAMPNNVRGFVFQKLFRKK
ncbi:MAG: glycosyltransferase [Prevotella sp.]|nr:glycosyltransferase [Prevotella sp.]